MFRILKKILPNKFIDILNRIRLGNYFFPFNILPIKDNKIVICNFSGKGYGDNGKYIVKEIINQRLDCDIVWLLKDIQNNTADFPECIRIKKYGSLGALYEMATAKVWIDNMRKSFFPPKRKKQYYIQTWHGGIALKQVEKDVESKLDKRYVEHAIHDSYMADLFISNSRFCTNMYRSAFWYDGEILECGSPRCDILINQEKEIEKKVKKYFNLNKNSHILIYAPTFRTDRNTKVYNIDFNQLIKILEKKYGGEWSVLIRLHPNISSKSNFMEYTSKIINATDYDDMYELLAVSDILITDYSSTMFEFSFTRRPVILYAPDIESYIKDRNFYFNIQNLPYSLAENNDQLFSSIEKFDSDVYLKNLEDFLSKLGLKEKGNASYQVVEKIKKIIS